MKKILITVIPAIVLLSCNTPKPSEKGSQTPATPTWSLTEIWSTDTVLTTCESVLFDEDRQQLYVSCINGSPAEKNGKGFLALLSPEGTIKNLDWVTDLDAPKGMGLRGDQLFVTDIDRLVIIDIEKAEIVGQVPVIGASFLNDVAVGADGKVYFTDSDSGIVWIFNEGDPVAWITEGLESPNGLYIEESRVLLTSSGSQDLKIIDKATGTTETVTSGIGQGDGVEFTGEEGHYLTSSWSGEIFLVLPDYSKFSLLKTSDQGINSADIGFNRDDRVVYVPTFFDNRVVAYKLASQ